MSPSGFNSASPEAPLCKHNNESCNALGNQPLIVSVKDYNIPPHTPVPEVNASIDDLVKTIDWKRFEVFDSERGREHQVCESYHVYQLAKDYTRMTSNPDLNHQHVFMKSQRKRLPFFLEESLTITSG